MKVLPAIGETSALPVKAGFLRDPDRLRAVATVALVNATSRHGNKVISQRYSTRTVFRGIAAQNGPSFSVHPCAERVMAIVNVPGLGAGALRGAPVRVSNTVSACRAAERRAPVRAAQGVGTRRGAWRSHLPQAYSALGSSAFLAYFFNRC